MGRAAMQRGSSDYLGVWREQRGCSLLPRRVQQPGNVLLERLLRPS